MTRDGDSYEVGVRELLDRLSEHLECVEHGRGGRPIARLTAIDGERPMQDLVRRGLITPPARVRVPRHAHVTARGSISDLVAEQRR